MKKIYGLAAALVAALALAPVSAQDFPEIDVVQILDSRIKGGPTVDSWGLASCPQPGSYRFDSTYVEVVLGRQPRSPEDCFPTLTGNYWGSAEPWERLESVEFLVPNNGCVSNALMVSPRNNLGGQEFWFVFHESGTHPTSNDPILMTKDDIASQSEGNPVAQWHRLEVCFPELGGRLGVVSFIHQDTTARDDAFVVSQAWYEAHSLSTPGEEGVGELNFGLATFPNPVTAGRPGTVEITLDQATEVNLALYDLLGREVAILADGPLTAGVHRLAFDTNGLPAGVYLIRLAADQDLVTRQVTVVR